MFISGHSKFHKKKENLEKHEKNSTTCLIKAKIIVDNFQKTPLKYQK